jgi:hypothetical protein
MSSTLSELAQLFLNQLKNLDPRLSNIPIGSTYDAIAGATAYAVNECQTENDLNYQKHFIQTATSSDLDYLVTDQYGSPFTRPQATQSSGLVTFYLNTETNSVTIPSGTVVKTSSSSGGIINRYTTTASVTLIPVTQTSISVSAICTTSGAIGNVPSNSINQIESSLSSSLVTVNNINPFSNGADQLSDGNYRTYIYNLLATYQKYVSSAIQAAALTVSGILYALPTETTYQVVQWNGSAPVGTPFTVNQCNLFVGIQSGTPSPAQLASVTTAIKSVRALGVYVNVLGMIGVPIDYTISISLNPSGTNYSNFSKGNFTVLTQQMSDNILSLSIVTAAVPTVTFTPSTQLTLLQSQFPTDFASITITAPATAVTITGLGQKFIPQTISVVSI